MGLSQPNMPASVPIPQGEQYPEWISDTLDTITRIPYGIAAGDNTKTITLSSISSLVEGQGFAFKNTTQNSADGPTLNLNGLGAKPIIRANGLPAFAGILKAGVIYTVRYDGSVFILQGEGSEYGTAIAGEVLTGKTIGTDTGIIAGTMPNRAGDTAMLSHQVSSGTLKLLPSDGYRDGVNDFVTMSNYWTTLGGRPVASGTVTSVRSGNSYRITVTGLGFQPSFIFADSSGGDKAYVTRTGFDSGAYANWYPWFTSGGIYTYGETSQSAGAFEINSDGFVMTVLLFELAGDQVQPTKWFAIG